MSLTHCKVEIPNEQTGINLDKVRIRKPNKTHGHMLMGEFTTFREFNDEIQLLCLSFKKAGNDYKLLPYKVGPKNFCEFLDGEKMLYPEFQAMTDLPELGACPWPAATYHIFGFQPDLSKVPPVLDTGDYMVECQIKCGDKLLNAIQIFASVMNMSPLG